MSELTIENYKSMSARAVRMLAREQVAHAKTREKLERAQNEREQSA